MTRCLTPELVEHWQEPVQRVHVESCPRCHALVDSYRSFLDARPITGADVEAAERKLASFLTTMPAAPNTAAGSRPRVHRVRAFRQPYWLAAAAAVLLLAIFLPRLGGGDDPSVLRDATPQTLQLLSPLPPQGERTAWLLRWDFVENADSYELRFYSTQLEELARHASLHEPQFLLESPAHEGALLWRVYAYRAGEVVAISAVGTLDAR